MGQDAAYVQLTCLLCLFVGGGLVPLPGTDLAQSTVAGLSLRPTFCLESKGMLLVILSLWLNEKFFFSVTAIPAVIAVHLQIILSCFLIPSPLCNPTRKDGAMADMCLSGLIGSLASWFLQPLPCGSHSTNSGVERSDNPGLDAARFS